MSGQETVIQVVDDEAEKLCRKCGEWWPATTEFFHRSAIGNLRSPCKACIDEKRRELVTKPCCVEGCEQPALPLALCPLLHASNLGGETMRRYMNKRGIRRITPKLPMGAFVEIVPLPIGAGGFDWHRIYIGRTGSVVGNPLLGIYEVQFGESGAGCFRPEALRMV
jgi:hypothetical protein